MSTRVRSHCQTLNTSKLIRSTYKWEMASELLGIMHKNVEDLAHGRLGMGRKAKVTSSCLINVVSVRPRVRVVCAIYDDLSLGLAQH